MRILVLEPYFGGSHKRFLTGLQSSLPYTFRLLTLPARNWKWRMRFSAPWYAEKLHALPPEFDVILCSSYVDVAALRGLAPDWTRRIPVCTYFHENQFVYPVQAEHERDYHFALTNFTTAAASDSLAFNSGYNLATFLKGCEAMIKKAPDMKMDTVDSICRKTTVLHPGLDFSAIDAIERPEKDDDIPVIIWNHRWEHDKNPELFFHTLFSLAEEGIAYKLIILGQTFSQQPDIFDMARDRLESRIVHFGYEEALEKYYSLLRRGSLVISTSRHEFFGMSVIEAVRAGCRPLLPRRLSYPELFPEEFLYNEEDLAERVKSDIRCGPLDSRTARDLTEAYSWENVKEGYRQWLRDSIHAHNVKSRLQGSMCKE